MKTAVDDQQSKPGVTDRENLKTELYKNQEHNPHAPFFFLQKKVASKFYNSCFFYLLL